MELAERQGMLTTVRINPGPTINEGNNYHPLYGIPLPLLLPPLKMWPSHLSPFSAVYVVDIGLSLPQNKFSPGYHQSFHLREL